MVLLLRRNDFIGRKRRRSLCCSLLLLFTRIFIVTECFTVQTGMYYRSNDLTRLQSTPNTRERATVSNPEVRLRKKKENDTGHYDQSTDQVVRSFSSNLHNVLKSYNNKINTTSSVSIDKRPAYALAIKLQDSTDLQRVLLNREDAFHSELMHTISLAFTVASHANDYKYILQTSNSIMQLMSASDTLSDFESSHMYILGRAVQELGSTNVNYRRIQTLLSNYTSHDQVMESNNTNDKLSSLLLISPLHLCEYMKSLLRRKKFSIALKTYKAYDQAYRNSGNIDSWDGLAVVLQGLRQVMNSTAVYNISAITSTASMYTMIPYNSTCWNLNTATDLIQSTRAISSATMVEYFNLISHATLQLKREYAVAAWNYFSTRSNNADTRVFKSFLSCLEARDSALILDQIRHQNKIRKDESNAIIVPNVYCYSFVMMACIDDCRYRDALNVFNKLCSSSTLANDSVALTPNTVVYNIALKATMKQVAQTLNMKRQPSARAKAFVVRKIQNMAEMIENMHMQVESRPGTISYNYLLSAVASVSTLVKDADVTSQLPSTLGIINEMREVGVMRDITTYKCALQANITDWASIMPLALADVDSHRDQSEFINLVLSHISNRGSVDLMYKVLKSCEFVKFTDETAVSFINAYSNSCSTIMLPDMMSLLYGDYRANVINRDLEVLVTATEGYEPSDVVSAIATAKCLANNDFNSARQILSVAKQNNVTLSDTALEELATAYSGLVMNNTRESTLETKNVQHWAETAYHAIDRIQHPTMATLLRVCKATAVAGLYDQACCTLASIYDLIGLGTTKADSSSLKSIAKLRNFLFRTCATTGNSTAALQFAEQVQASTDKFVDELCRRGGTTSDSSNIGMTLTNWRYLIVAASKSGNWHLCLNTLQYFQDDLIALRHNTITTTADESHDGDRTYAKLSKALDASVKCLAWRSQYAWTVRAISDWIEWSERPPPISTVMTIIRILCPRGQGESVVAIVCQCIGSLAMSVNEDWKREYGVALYKYAITRLHSAGLFTHADELLTDALSRKYIDLTAEWKDGNLVLDLHNTNMALARSFVRVTMAQEVLSRQGKNAISSSNTSHITYNEDWDADMIIITGLGRNSKQRYRPVLRPEVQRMLVEEFYPPLNTMSVPNNMGALLVSSQDIAAWINYQSEMKDAKLLSVAAVLRGLSSGRQLRLAITRRMENSE